MINKIISDSEKWLKEIKLGNESRTCQRVEIVREGLDEEVMLELMPE